MEDKKTIIDYYRSRLEDAVVDECDTQASLKAFEDVERSQIQSFEDRKQRYYLHNLIEAYKRTF